MSKLYLFFWTALLLVSSCFLGSDEENDQYEDEEIRVTFQVPGQVEYVIPNDYRASTSPIVEAYEPSADGFYLISSPEMLDSMFSSVNFPGIEDLFPEDGDLLLYTRMIYFSQTIEGCTPWAAGDTVGIDMVVRSWYDRIYDPGIWFCGFPVGVVYR